MNAPIVSHYNKINKKNTQKKAFSTETMQELLGSRLKKVPQVTTHYPPQDKQASWRMWKVEAGSGYASVWAFCLRNDVDTIHNSPLLVFRATMNRLLGINPDQPTAQPTTSTPSSCGLFVPVKLWLPHLPNVRRCRERFATALCGHLHLP